MDISDGLAGDLPKLAAASAVSAHVDVGRLPLSAHLKAYAPLGQAQEFYAGLVERGCVAELVVYPREGHGFQERGHRRDSWQRAIAWFDRYLKAD